ncbi:MAG: rhomboid protease GluP [Paracoccaceae bacterium]|jgi:rhomboid protease GluP
MSDQNLSPFNAMPPVVLALAAVIAGLELMFQLAIGGMLGGQGGVGWRLAAIADYGMLDEVVQWMIANNSYPTEQLLRFVTYPLIHGSFTHAAFVVVFVLAIGKMVGEVFSSLAFLAVFMTSAIMGALAFTLLFDSPYPLIGGYPGVYGLIGSFTYLLWMNLAAHGANQNRAFSLIGILLAIQLLFGFINSEFASVAADLAGFTTGFVLSFVVSPGGWQRILIRMRSR